MKAAFAESRPKGASDFESRFAQCKNALTCIAARVLGDGELPEEALRSCFQRASSDPSASGEKRRSAVGCWRILIDEALLIRSHKERA
jgi:hypothetical protein